MASQHSTGISFFMHAMYPCAFTVQYFIAFYISMRSCDKQSLFLHKLILINTTFIFNSTLHSIDWSPIENFIYNFRKMLIIRCKQDKSLLFRIVILFTFLLINTA